MIGAAAHFATPETAALTKTVSIPPGTYDTRVYMIATAEDAEHLRASIGVLVEGADILMRAPRNRPEQFGWRWVRGATMTVANEPITIRIVADHLLGHARSYADIAYVGFIRQRGTPRAGQAEPFEEPWPGEIMLSPGERWRWTLQIDADMPRVDIWVFERGADGRSYHIYDVRAPEAPAEN